MFVSSSSLPPHPVSLGPLAPVEVAARLGHLPGLVFFDSALEKQGRSQLSIIAAEPTEIVSGEMARDWPRLAETLRRYAAEEPRGPHERGRPHGFAAGYAGYHGHFEFAFYQQALFYDHLTRAWSELGTLSARLAPTAPAAAPPTEALHFQTAVRREAFLHMVERAQQYIAAGDIYQVNLAHRWESPFTGDPLAFYRALRECSPAPQAAFLKMSDHQILSTSPELFLQMSGRHIRTRPIKGTRPRRADPQADEKSHYDLITSPKEIAELVMITDLERNDLGKVCDWGTVEVRELLATERFAQVFHLVSTVEGRLRAGLEQATAFRECFPGGSITGAPKKRACEIIAELEPAARDLYTGAIGWFGFNGESQFSIAIRTVVTEPGRAHFHVGAGIVADSQPEREWEETLDKAAGILLAAERLNAAAGFSARHHLSPEIRAVPFPP